MWNTSGVEVNGNDFTGAYASAVQLPAMIDGAYYVCYDGRYPWSHFEASN